MTPWLRHAIPKQISQSIIRRALRESDESISLAFDALHKSRPEGLLCNLKSARIKLELEEALKDHDVPKSIQNLITAKLEQAKALEIFLPIAGSISKPGHRRAESALENIEKLTAGKIALDVRQNKLNPVAFIKENMKTVIDDMTEACNQADNDFKKFKSCIKDITKYSFLYTKESREAYKSYLGAVKAEYAAYLKQSRDYKKHLLEEFSP